MSQIKKKTIRKHYPEVFRKKTVKKNFTKFRGKHPCQSLFFNKVAGYKLVILSKYNSGTVAFECKFCEVLHNNLFIEHLGATASELTTNLLRYLL